MKRSNVSRQDSVRFPLSRRYPGWMVASRSRMTMELERGFMQLGVVPPGDADVPGRERLRQLVEAEHEAVAPRHAARVEIEWGPA